jgi:hypothetical protein
MQKAAIKATRANNADATMLEALLLLLPVEQTCRQTVFGVETTGVLGVLTTGTLLGVETLETGPLHGAQDPLLQALIPIV